MFFRLRAECITINACNPRLPYSLFNLLTDQPLSFGLMLTTLHLLRSAVNTFFCAPGEICTPDSGLRDRRYSHLTTRAYYIVSPIVKPWIRRLSLSGWWDSNPLPRVSRTRMHPYAPQPDIQLWTPYTRQPQIRQDPVTFWVPGPWVQRTKRHLSR